MSSFVTGLFCCFFADISAGFQRMQRVTFPVDLRAGTVRASTGQKIDNETIGLSRNGPND